MKVYILYSNEYPGIGAASRRISNYVKGLEGLNVDVKVVSITPRNKNVFLLFLPPIITIMKLIKIKSYPDFYFVYGFGWFSKLIIIWFAKMRGIKVVFEVNEKPYSIRDSGRRDLLFRYFVPINQFFLSRIVYPFVNGFVVISESLNEFVIKYSSKSSEIIKIPIIVDYNFYQQDQIPKVSVNHPFLLHTATLNDVKDGIIDVFKAFVLIHKKFNIPLHFYLSISRGLSKVTNEVDRIVNDSQLNKFVHYLDEPDDITLLAYQRACDAVVINKKATEQNKYNFATKIGEYLVLGKPIITTPIGEVTNYLQDGKHCYYVAPNKPEAIAKKLSELLHNPESFNEIQQNAKSVAYDEFGIDVNAKRLYQFFSLITS